MIDELMRVDFATLLSPLLAQEPAAPSFLEELLRGPWPLLLLLGVMFYLILIRPERRKRAEMSKMLEELKKNDRVVTIGGIYGTVVNVQKGSEDVTLRVDENNNTRMRVLRSAISRVVTDTDAETKAGKSEAKA